jgi:hypothetical protein
MYMEKHLRVILDLPFVYGRSFSKWWCSTIKIEIDRPSSILENSAFVHSVIKEICHLWIVKIMHFSIIVTIMKFVKILTKLVWWKTNLNDFYSYMSSSYDTKYVMSVSLYTILFVYQMMLIEGRKMILGACCIVYFGPVALLSNKYVVVVLKRHYAHFNVV